MNGRVDWESALQTWLEPFLVHLGHPARRRMCPLYVAGLIGPGERKSLQPIAARLAPADYDQLHHFVAVGPWDQAPLETELLVQADRLVGGSQAVLVIDDTALPKKIPCGWTAAQPGKLRLPQPSTEATDEHRSPRDRQPSHRPAGC